MTTIPDEWKTAEKSPLDFILVGAGAGGAPLAARLVERGYTVLVIEMGPRKPKPPEGAKVENTEVPLLHSETTEDARHSLRFFVKHFDGAAKDSLDPKLHVPKDPAKTDDPGIFYPRAQGVGGCTVHNAMITIVGPSEDYDEIAEATGDESWRGERMRPYFQRLERCHYAKPTLWGRVAGLLGFGDGWQGSRHGYRGWLDTTLSDLHFLKSDRQFLKIALSAALGAVNDGVDNLGELFRATLTGQAYPALDPNHWETMRRSQAGISRIPCAIGPTGERSGPRERLLGLLEEKSPHKSRLRLLEGVFVTKVILEPDNAPGDVGGLPASHRAVGVMCLCKANVYEGVENAEPAGEWEKEAFPIRCKAGGEVVLCGGAFNTPQLLMLSGVGPQAHLKEHGIDAKVDLPGVGKNLQDRYEVPVTATLKDRFRSLDGVTLSSAGNDDPQLKLWKDNPGQPAFNRGLYSTNGGVIGVFARSKQEDMFPDLFVFALAGFFPGYHVGWSKPQALLGYDRSLGKAKIDETKFGEWLKTGPRKSLTWLILKARTRSRGGEVLLRSDSPFRRPDINFRSFPDAKDVDLDRNLKEPDKDLFNDVSTASNDKDLEALHEGVRLVRDFLKKNEHTLEVDEPPGYAKFNGNLRKYIKHTAWGHHACGTCRIGTDGKAVLDSRFRVRGVRGLRVVDASVFPRIPGFFIVANVYMISEKAADVLAEDHPRDPEALPPEAKAARKQDPILLSSAEADARRVYPAELEAREARLIRERRERALPKEAKP